VWRRRGVNLGSKKEENFYQKKGYWTGSNYYPYTTGVSSLCNKFDFLERGLLLTTKLLSRKYNNI
jgi:hypothetical protein